MPSTPLYELDDVSLAIDDVTILDGIDLIIPDQGITVLVGPSGAGKSMLLRLLNRLEVRTDGQIRFRGDPIDALDPLALRRRVGMVFQRPAPFPGTVRDNLLVADPTATDDQLAAALDDARLEPSFLDRSADDLSGGEAQRMCLARTLVTQPEALLMDEPTSALDPDARHRLERTARRLADAGRPLVWVTHDLEQADRLADDVVVLVAGRIATGDERTRFLTNAGPATDADTDPSGETGETGASGEIGGAGASGEAGGAGGAGASGEAGGAGGAGASGETGAGRPGVAEDQEDARG